MKRSLYIFCLLIICLVCLSSCATSKNTDTQKQADYTDDFSRIQKSIESLKADVIKQTQVTTDKLSNLKIENRTVILSPPDSTGRQYPMQESTTTASKDEKENTRIDETVNISIQQLATRIDSLAEKLTALINEKQTVVELSWWDLNKDKIYAGIIVVLFLAGIVLSYQLKRSRSPLS